MADRAHRRLLPLRGSGANDFGDAFAEYALYYGLGVDAVVTARGGAAIRYRPDLAVIARRG